MMEGDMRKNAIEKHLKWFCVLSFLLLAAGCAAEGEHGFFDHESLPEKLEKQTATPPAPFAATGFDAGDVVSVADSVRGAFKIPQRTSGMVKYPCSTCHNVSLQRLKALTPAAERDAHWDIELRHASEQVMQCITCHAEKNMDELRSLTGQPVSFDQSFQVCAQCHASQYSDWLGGAHGKRLSGWGAERVAQTCVGCHNPHRPQWEKRWPAILERTQ